MRPTLSVRSMLALAAVAAAGISAHAQARIFSTVLPNTAVATALPASSSSTDLPDAPSSATDGEGQAGNLTLTASPGQIAPKYKGIILPGQSAQPLTAGNKVTYGFIQAVQPLNILAWGISSAYSQAVDSAPHYGQGWGPYGQRYGAAAARGTMQTLATDSIFSPIFHDDPRYYELGRQHKILNRGIYAATRTVITRSDSGKQRVNLPLLVGYAVAAGATNAFYPQRDRSFGQTAETYGGSVGGAALGFLVNEFLDDALHIVHVRK